MKMWGNICEWDLSLGPGSAQIPSFLLFNKDVLLVAVVGYKGFSYNVYFVYYDC